MANQPTKFEHTNLSAVDPGMKTLPDGQYNLRVAKAEVKSYTPKDGGEGEYVNVSYNVVESPEFSGRRIYDSFFPGDKTMQRLRTLMDATGVVPNGDGTLNDVQDIVSWLDEIRTSGATFSAAVSTKDELNKKTQVTAPRTSVGFKFSPAQ